MSASRSVHLHARLDLGSGGRVSLFLDAQPARQAPEVGNIIVGNESVGNIIVGNVQSRAQWVRCLGIVTQVDIAYKTFYVVWQQLAGPADPWQTCEDSVNSNILKSHTLVGKAKLDGGEPHLTKWHPAGCDVQEEQAIILMTEVAKYALPKKRLPKPRLPGDEQAFGTHSRRSASLAPRSTTPPPRSTTPPPRSTTPPPRSTTPPPRPSPSPPPPSPPPPPPPEESCKEGDVVEAMSCGGGRQGSSCWAKARVIKRTGQSAAVEYTDVHTEPKSGRIIVTAADDTPRGLAKKYALPV